MLGVIDSAAEPDAKEAKLKTLKDWNYFYSNYFRTLRFATLRFNGSSAVANETDGTAGTGVNAVAGAITNAPATVIFGLNKSNINKNIFDNAQVLAAISEVLGGQAPEQVNGITIVSTGSPEGPEYINKRPSLERGAALREYIVSEYPALEGKIKVIPAGEAWEDFRAAVESDVHVIALGLVVDGVRQAALAPFIDAVDLTAVLLNQT